jgi:hypothetical protein
MMTLLERCDRVLEQRRVGFVLLVVLSLIYVAAYLRHPLFPGHEQTDAARGWWTWTDQNRYLVESRAIASLQLDASNYFYPVGYPAMGAVFVRWMPLNPFLIPNLACILIAAAAWWRLARRWVGGTLGLVAAIVFVVSHPWLISQTMIVPWNTLPTTAAFLVGTAILFEMRSAGAVLALALLAALTYLVRPSDAVTFAPLLICATLRLPTWRERFQAGLLGILIVVGSVAFVGGLNLALIGQWRTAYEVASTQMVGFFSYPISYKLYWLFVDGGPLFAETEPALLFRYPWLFLLPTAAVFLVVKEQFTGTAVLAAVGVNVLLYVNYNDLLPSDIYRFTLIHYVAWCFPLMFLLVVAAGRHWRRSRLFPVSVGCSAALLAVCAGLRLQPSAIAAATREDGVYTLPDVRPLLIEFPGIPMERLPDLRFDGRPLTEYSEYLVPLVPSELKLLLARKANVKTLSFAHPGSQYSSSFARYTWTWKPALSRFTADTAY